MTLNDIMSAFFTRLNTLSPMPPVAWPGTVFTPPATGVWIEPDVIPNNGLDNGLAPTDEVVPQGFCQVIVWTRPGGGMFQLATVANNVAALFPKDHRLSGLVRVQRNPWITNIDSQDDRIGYLVSIPYSQ